MSYANRYASAAAGTASRERLMAMLFEKALADIRVGASALESGQHIDARRSLMSALAIVTELHLTLDRPRSPDLCDALARIYEFVLTRLGEASLRSDARLARDAERAFTPVAEGFTKAATMIPHSEVR